MSKGRKSAAAPVTPEVVDAGWLLRAAGIVVVFALVCGYATFCVLFYQGQWQMMLHPVRSGSAPASIDGAAYERVRFGPDATGVPQRVGWWMPAEPEAQFRHVTLLVLPSGQTDLAGMTAKLAELREAGVSVFAVDYRGYGQSEAIHPSEERMREDSEAAWRYLTNERHLQGARVLPYGVGLGGVMALGLAKAHPEIAAVVLDGPRFDVEGEVARDPRVRLLPVHLLLKDRFALEPELRTLKTPKLIVTHAAEESRRALNAGDPKMTVALPEANRAEFEAALHRFLDLYAPPTPIERLLPSAGQGGSK